MKADNDWPRCAVLHDGGIIPEAVALAPQSTDGGATIDTWVLVCEDEIDTWWDDGDWVGGFVWFLRVQP